MSRRKDSTMTVCTIRISTTWIALALLVPLGCGLPDVAFDEATGPGQGPGAPADPGGDGSDPAPSDPGDDEAGDDSDGDDDGEQDPPTHPAAAACEAYCAVRTTCGQTSAGCQSDCEAQWTRDDDEIGVLCASAWVDYVTCQSGLGCGDYEAHVAGEPDEHPTYPCEGPQVSYRRACGQWTTVFFPCRDGTSVPERSLCDGKADCAGGEDESAAASCFQCGSGEVVPSLRRCDHAPDCADGSDEHDAAGCDALPI